MTSARKKLLSLWRSIGPGFITGASDDDPSGIGTYSQTGAQFGYSQLWTAPFSFPFMATIQEMCGRIGVVTGNGLAGVIRAHYSKKILAFTVLLLLFANTINIGANLGAMAASAQLLIPLPFPVLVVGITAITLLLEIFISYRVYVKYLKYLTLAFFAYVATAFLVEQNWSAVIWSTLVPSIAFTKEYLLNIVAILGTTISPYLFFWQASEEVEEVVLEGKVSEEGIRTAPVRKKEIRKLRVDTTIGMFFSNMIMFFIILTTASTLHAHGITEVSSAPAAALVLKPLAGPLAFFLFTVGILGSGLIGVPVLAGSASYACSEALGMKEGLSKPFLQAKGFYIIIALATMLGLFVNFLHIPPFTLLYYTAALNGIVAPPLLILILLIANNKKIMKGHTNSRPANALAITITVIMSVCAVALLLSFL